MKLGLLLTLVTSPLAAQSVRSRLEARVPTGAVSTVDSLVQVAAREGLPTEPLVQKALEGGAKHVPAPRIGAAAQEMLEQLRDARALLVRAGDAPPATAAEVTTIYAALKRGVPAPVVERVVAAMPREPRGSALPAVADLAAPRFDPDSCAGPVTAAPAIVVAQQPSPMQGQMPAADSAKAKPAKKGSKKAGSKKHAAKPTAKPAAKDSSKMKP